MFIFLFVILPIALTLIYVGVAIEISVRAFGLANNITRTPPKVGNWTEKNLIKAWNDRYQYHSLYSDPNLTLRDYYKQVDNVLEERETRYLAMKARAYRRMFWSPIWPVLIATDIAANYKKATLAERTYNLELATAALKKSQEDKEKMNSLYQEAEDALTKLKKDDSVA